MGLMSILALVITPLVRSSRALPSSRSNSTKELEQALRERDEARADAARWEALAHRWEARYEQAINPILAEETRAQVRHWAMLQQVYAQQQTQMNQQLAQQAIQHQGQLGMMQQNVFAGWNHCTCVPARSSLLRGD
jgi:hypothetical protein